MARRRYKPPTEEDGFRPIPAELAERYIGKRVHVAHCDRGCVWVLERIDGARAILRTPKSHRHTWAPVTSLVATRADSATALA